MNWILSSLTIAALTWYTHPAMSSAGAQGSSGHATRLQELPHVLQYLEFTPSPTIAWSGDSAIALFDREAHQVVLMLLRNGRSQRVGRSGQGPGEFSGPLVLAAEGAGSILTAEVRERRVQEFRQFRFVRGQSTSALGVPLGFLGWRAERARGLWQAANGLQVATLDLADRRVSRIVSVSELVAKARIPAEWRDTSVHPNAFVLDHGYIAIGNASTYRMAAVNVTTGEVTPFGRPELPSERPTERDLADLREEFLLSSARDYLDSKTLAEIVRRRAARPKPRINGWVGGRDSQGRLWIPTTRGDGMQTHLDVFSPSGRFIGTTTLRDRILSMSFRDRFLIVLVERRDRNAEERFGIDLYTIEPEGAYRS